MVGRYEDSIATYRKVLDSTPDNLLAHAGLTAAYSLAGRLDEARAQAEEVLRVQPKFSAISTLTVLGILQQHRSLSH